MASVAVTLATFSLGVTMAVVVAGSASASGSLPATTTTTPADQFLVINGSVNAASDHEIVASSAFPNFTTGAVDNYYSMARTHVDNSPFAEGTASPADTGPAGQTAAAGNFQQPQYADARWPGGPATATYGDQGQPFAEAAAGVYLATADASEPSRGLSSPGMKLPVGFNLKLEQALAQWKAKWNGLLGTKKPAPPAVTTPKAPITAPKAPVTTPTAVPKAPTATVPTPLGTVTTPHLGGVSPAPPTKVPPPGSPSAGAPGASRSMASTSTPKDGESLLTSWTKTSLVRAAEVPKTDTNKFSTTSTDTTSTSTSPTTTTSTAKTGTTTTATAPTYALVTSGESSLGKVVLGGGQIVIEGIHVRASIANAGDPAFSASVSVASATIGGIPVTIDEDGVHIAGHGQSVPYQKASDSLNTALKQAGIQLFLVGPEVTMKNSCDQSGFGSGSGSGTTTTTSTTTSTTSTSDQSGTTGSCGQPPPMDATCDQTGTGTSTGGTTTTGTTTTTAAQPSLPGQSTTTSTTTTSSQSGSTAPSSTCAGTAPPMTTSCSATGKGAGTAPPSSSSTSPTTTTSSSDQFGAGPSTTGSGEVVITATGLHVVFTQPVTPPGVPAQYIEHILGEVLVDSLATPAGPVGPLPDLGFNSPAGSSSSSSPSSSSCFGGGKTGASSGASIAGGSGSSLAGVSGASGSLASAGGSSAFGSSASQPTSGSTGQSFPAAFVHALRKPLWLLLAYVLWQAIVIATGTSLWKWRRGGAS